MEEDEALPDHLRCHRTDGRQWRCTRRVMGDKKLCELHYIQGRHRQYKQKVPASLKLKRKPNKKRAQESEPQNPGIRAKKRDKTWKIAGAVKEGRSVDVSEALDETLKKMKLKRGNLHLELIREFLKRQVKKKKERALERTSEGELMRELPNGLMEISPSLCPQHLGSTDSSCNVKLGLDSSSSLRRCFRSKNIEPLPIGSLQMVPYARNVEILKRRRRKNCHWCRKNCYRTMIKCLSCRKVFFCLDCIKERFFDKQEVRMACPVCRGTCSCRACSKNQSKDVKLKDLFLERKKIDRIQLLHYLIYMLLPVLERINQDQSIELDIEAKIKGKTPLEIQIKQAELECNKLYCCSNCKTSIVDFHRSCMNCSYKLCVNCSWELFREDISGSVKAFISKYPNIRKAGASGERFLSKTRLTRSSRKSFGSKYLASPTLLLKWKACDDGSIPCPPVALGGCGDSFLDLRCVFPFNWTKDLEVRAEKVVCSSDFPEASDISSCCSICRGHEAGETMLLQGVATREDSSDNSLYYPILQDLRDGSFEHFQKHWVKGHPVIVRNVLLGTSNLSWDPVVMFCTYLEKSYAKPKNGKEAVKAKNCLDWCEIEFGVKHIFMGSLEGRTHANMRREMLKFKGWLSSYLFQEQFPAHYSEIIRSLPLQEYMNPISGLLNLAVKLPQDIPKTDLGPCIYISYGRPEELMQAEFLTKLCFESCDVVNILAYATDVPISTEQLTNIKQLLKNYKAQDDTGSSRNKNDQKTTDEVKGKSSLSSENTEEVGSQVVIGEQLPLHNGFTSLPLYSDESHKDCVSSLKDGNMSHSKDRDSEFDSETSMLCYGSLQSSEESDNQNFIQDDVESSSCSRKKLVSNPCGAQWDIFRRQDVPKLIEYLKKHSNEFSQTCSLPKHVVHPILDESFFLDAAHKMRLKEEFNIEPWTFDQHVGEAVIIPAGCPYQIRKLKSCVNVVLNFVSPENATECINLINELRLLPIHHKAKEKMLEVKKMTLYGVNAAIKEISNTMCAENTMELVV